MILLVGYPITSKLVLIFHFLVIGEDSEPIIVISGSFLDFLLLVFLSIPLPILLSVPVKAFVYMDMNRRRLQNSQEKNCNFLCCCCCKRKEPEVVVVVSDEVSDHSDIDEEAPADASSVPTSSLIITRFQRLNQQHNIMTTVIRERFTGPEESAAQSDDTRNPATNPGTSNAHIIIPVRFPSLYDLGSISEDIVETNEAITSPTNAEEGINSLPPSYSQAEGLDQLPSYSEVDVSRVRLGPYVMVYDKGQKNLLTFKK